MHNGSELESKPERKKQRFSCGGYIPRGMRKHPAAELFKVVIETWEEVMTRFFKVVHLKARYRTVIATPAVEIKETVLKDILKEVEDLFKKDKEKGS